MTLELRPQLASRTAAVIKKAIKVIALQTRRICIDPFYIFYWDLLPRMTKKILPVVKADSDKQIPITIITYKRPHYFGQTLQSFIDKNRHAIDRFRLYIIIQGEYDTAYQQIIKKHETHIHHVLHIEKNIGCGLGYSRIIAEALKDRPDFVIHLEDDFISNDSVADYLEEMIDFLSKHPEVGYIRLRSIHDRVKDYNYISRRKIRYKKATSSLWLGNAHFTFNPTIIRRDILEKLIPVSDEFESMKKYQKLGLDGAQLQADCFSHIGQERADDWQK